MAVVTELRRLMSSTGVEPALLVDANLRPEGRQGPLIRSLDSYAEYYARWSAPWEAQALTRARPVAGDPALGRAFVELIDPLRWPVGGLPDPAVREIRRIKARVESERLPRGADPLRHLKLGPGGLADVEWTVQLLQLRHGRRVPELRTPSTLDALAAAVGAGLITEPDAARLARAWRLASRLRNAIMLWSGRANDLLPVNVRELEGITRLAGYPEMSAGGMEEEHRRTARRARAVVDRVFYG
jgi:glutamate-ammonia-ligase adenylyltransferase